MSETRFRDPVHNFMPFTDKEVDLIDSPVLQRLRGIRQLALASLVYPGALHTRFDHTLGVTHVAGQMAATLGFRSPQHEDEYRLVRYAALLHDIGHGPFSHVSENALERCADRGQLPPGQKKEKIHEVITGHLIRHHPDVLRILGKDDCERVAQLLSVGHGEPALRAIVSGPLDADKQDYLLRDSRFCGVDYGVFDIHQLQRSLVSERDNHSLELMVREDGLHVVEQFVLAKYYLTSQVYRHRVRLITDQMITRAIILGIEDDGLPELQRLYAFDGSEAFYDNFLRWNDARFLHAFGDEAPDGSKCKALLARLTTRNLLKRVFRLAATEFSAGVRESLMEITKPDQQRRRREAEGVLARLLTQEFGSPVDPGWTILHTFQIKSVRESSRNDEKSILVWRPGQPPGAFETKSVMFKSIDERLSDQYVEVYAPVAWENHADRDRRLARLTPLIQECIAETVQPQQNLLDL